MEFLFKRNTTFSPLRFLCVRDVFFFQAEDGIRDHCVTGVQTCALPIFAFALAAALSACAPSALSTARSQIAAANYPAARQELVALSARTDLNESQRREVKEIGRASCRERV